MTAPDSPPPLSDSHQVSPPPPPPISPPALSPQGHGNRLVAVIIWLVVLGGLGLGAYFAWRYYESSQKPADAKAGAGGTGRSDRPQPVVAEEARSGDMPLYIESIGSVIAYNNITIRTRIDGQLEKVAFTEGQVVHAGDLLFQIDPRPYQVQLAQAQSQLSQAEGQVAKDKATRENAQRDVDRFHAASEAVSQQQIDTADATLANAKGALEVDKGSIEAAKAAIDSAKLNITYCTITAPITGKIGLRIVDEGNMVHASDAAGLAVITQLQPISVVFSPAEDNLPRVQKALAGDPHLVVEAWDREHKERLAVGHVEALDNQIDPGTLTFKLKASFPNDDNALFPNQAVNVNLLVETLHDVVLVPEAAAQHSPTSIFIYVVKSDNTVDMREVDLGDTQNHLTVIKKGIAPGEIVVTDGVDKLQPGSKVVVRKAGEAATQAESATSTSGPASQRGKKKGSKGPGS
jgi:membrane fusion protein, multidrug efflux system